MRSELAIQAAEAVPNRFQLMHVASVLTRRFHRRTKDRLPETINSCLAGLAEGKYYVVDHTVKLGEIDLDWYNGFTGEAQCSYAKPSESVTADCGQMLETA